MNEQSKNLEILLRVGVDAVRERNFDAIFWVFLEYNLAEEMQRPPDPVDPITAMCDSLSFRPFRGAN